MYFSILAENLKKAFIIIHIKTLILFRSFVNLIKLWMGGVSVSVWIYGCIWHKIFCILYRCRFSGQKRFLFDLMNEFLNWLFNKKYLKLGLDRLKNILSNNKYKNNHSNLFLVDNKYWSKAICIVLILLRVCYMLH